MQIIIVVLALALAVSAVSMTLTKAKVFKGLRAWTAERSSWFGGLLKCPYCTSHWLAAGAVAIYQPRIVTSSVLLMDLAVSAFAIIALAAFSSGLIFRAFAAMGPD